MACLSPMRPTCCSSIEKRSGRQFEDKGVSLEIDLPPELPAVLADEDRIGQVVLNLLGNALQYTPAGRAGRIRARGAAAGVRLENQDEGIGIPAEHLQHTFT